MAIVFILLLQLLVATASPFNDLHFTFTSSVIDDATQESQHPLQQRGSFCGSFFNRRLQFCKSIHLNQQQRVQSDGALRVDVAGLLRDIFTPRRQQHYQQQQRRQHASTAISAASLSSNKIGAMAIHGGATKRKRVSAKKKRAAAAVTSKKSFLKRSKEMFNQILPATRMHVSLCLFCTVIHCLGLPAPVFFSLDISKLYELWRPFTAVAYLGAPSMSMANSLYFLMRYGQTLENENGTGAHAWFLFVQTMLLGVMGLILGFPLQAKALIAACVYVSSRVHALDDVPIQFGLMIKSWQLPYSMMIIDCLAQQSAGAAWPHVIGILSGHFYHFFTKVWPALGGRAWLQPPKWILRRFGEKSSGLGQSIKVVGSEEKASKKRRRKSKK